MSFLKFSNLTPLSIFAMFTSINILVINICDYIKSFVLKSLKGQVFLLCQRCLRINDYANVKYFSKIKKKSAQETVKTLSLMFKLLQLLGPRPLADTE